MTATQAFNTIINALKEQGEPAYFVKDVSSISCKYRIDKDGKTLKCAAGHIIPDDRYHPHMEGEAFDYDFCKKFKLGDLVDNNPNTIDTINKLQEMHDYWAEDIINPASHFKEFATEALHKASQLAGIKTQVEFPFQEKK